MTAQLETERDFARWLNDAAKMFGWRFAHFRPARTKYGWVTPMEGDKGWPDYVLLRPPRLILAELKRAARASSIEPEQKTWLRQLGQVHAACENCGDTATQAIEVYVWDPKQRDEILLCLALEQSPASLAEVRGRLRMLTEGLLS